MTAKPVLPIQGVRPSQLPGRSRCSSNKSAPTPTRQYAHRTRTVGPRRAYALFLEGQRIALKRRIEHGRKPIRAVGGVRLLQITVLVMRASAQRSSSPLGQ
jgi:hypothetical protein